MTVHETILPDVYARVKRLEQAVFAAMQATGTPVAPDLLTRIVGLFLESGLAVDEAVSAYGDMYRRAHEANGGRPLLGLRPRYVVVPERIAEIVAAMGRYSAEYKPIPSDWLDELRELSQWLDWHQSTMALRA